MRRQRLRVLVCTTGGIEQMDAARVAGQWAVHRPRERRRGWCVTHMDTGIQMECMRLQRDAVAVIRRLAPVEFTADEIVVLKEHVRGGRQLTLPLARRLRDIRLGLRAFGVMETAGGLSELKRQTREEKTENETVEADETKERGGETCSAEVIVS